MVDIYGKCREYIPYMDGMVQSFLQLFFCLNAPNPSAVVVLEWVKRVPKHRT